MERAYKALILTCLTLYLVYWFLPYLEPFLADSEETLAFWDSTGFDRKFLYPTWYPYLWLAFWVVTYAGLYLQYRPRRTIFVVGYIFEFLITPFLGTIILSPWSAIVYDLNTLANGAVLAVVYLTTVAKSFEHAARRDQPQRREP